MLLNVIIVVVYCDALGIARGCESYAELFRVRVAKAYSPQPRAPQSGHWPALFGRPVFPVPCPAALSLVPPWLSLLSRTTHRAPIYLLGFSGATVRACNAIPTNVAIRIAR